MWCFNPLEKTSAVVVVVVGMRTDWLLQLVFVKTKSLNPVHKTMKLDHICKLDVGMVEK